MALFLVSTPRNG